MVASAAGVGGAAAATVGYALGYAIGRRRASRNWEDTVKALAGG